MGLSPVGGSMGGRNSAGEQSTAKSWVPEFPEPRMAAPFELTLLFDALDGPFSDGSSQEE